MDHLIETSEASRLPVLHVFDLTAGSVASFDLPVDAIGFSIVTHTQLSGGVIGQLPWAYNAADLRDAARPTMLIPYGEVGGVMGLKLDRNETIHIGGGPHDAHVEVMVFLRA